MALDLSSLEKAITSLENLVHRTQDPGFMNGLDEIARNGLMAGVIQNFEFTYELCRKFIQRWIRINKTPEDAEPRTRKDLFRMAAQYGLVRDPLPWFEYGEARNITSHTYDEATADRVYEAAVRFPGDAKYLLDQLKAAND